MAKDVYQVSVKAIIVRPDGKILGLKANVGDVLEGYYDVPGGRIETDEFATPLMEILKREIKEETGGLDVELEERPVSLGRIQLLKGEQHRIFYIFFVGKLKENVDNIKISDEHEGFAWLDVTPENVEQYFTKGTLEGIKGYLQNR